MTLEDFTPTPAVIISGTGPYTIKHPYRDAGDLRVYVTNDVDIVLLPVSDYSILPLSSETEGTLTLGATAATTYDAYEIYFFRDTLAEQGWKGITSREVGLEGQLDNNVMALQDAQQISGDAIRVLESDGQGNFVKNVGEISSAQGYAVAAAASAAAAAEKHYTTRALFVAAVVGGLSLTDGSTVMAGGWLYVADSTATSLPDLSGWKPDGGTANVHHFGSVGGGVEDDTAAITAIDIPTTTKDGDTYLTTLANFNAVAENVYGRGTIVTAAGKLAPEWRNISARPSSLSDAASLLTAFNGDFSKVGRATGMVVSGDALGTPTGYVFTPETSVNYSWVRMEAGSSGAIGSGTDTDRTGYVTNRHVIEMRGQGDAIVNNSQVNVFVGRDAGATNHLEFPAGVLYGGAVSAFTDRVSLAWGESHFEDNGFQARGTGPLIRFTRDNNAETYGEFWNGVRLSSNGAHPIDAAYQVVGKFKVGLDLSMMTDVTAAIALASGQRMDFHTAAPINAISGIQRYAETLNDWSLGHDTSFGGFTFKGAGVQVGGYTSTYWTFGRQGTDDTSAVRLVGSSATADLRFGQFGANSYITAASSGADNTSLYFRTASAGSEATSVVIDSSGSVNIARSGQSLKIEGAAVIGARKTGWGIPTGTATRTAFDTATVTTPELAETVKALVDDMRAHGSIGA